MYLCLPLCTVSCLIWDNWVEASIRGCLHCVFVSVHGICRGYCEKWYPDGYRDGVAALQ